MIQSNPAYSYALMPQYIHTRFMTARCFVVLCFSLPHREVFPPRSINFNVIDKQAHPTNTRISCKMVRAPKVLKLVAFVVRRFPSWWTLSLFLWCFLSSCNRNELPSTMMNQNVQLLIAHPDDEVMFFAPTLIELSKPQWNNNIAVTCFSTGNAMGLGAIRAKELERSLEILGIHNVQVLSDESKFKDAMNITWNTEDIVEYVHMNTTMVLTFDEGGVSNHPNHRSLYHAAMTMNKAVVSLYTYPVWEKYSATFITNWQLLWGDSHEGTVTIHSNWAGYLLSLASMVSAHKSQMEWFRYGWLLLSNYLNTNRLVVHRTL